MTVDVWTVFVISKVIRRKEYIPRGDIALFIVSHVQDRGAEIWALLEHLSRCFRGLPLGFIPIENTASGSPLLPMHNMVGISSKEGEISTSPLQRPWDRRIGLHEFKNLQILSLSLASLVLERRETSLGKLRTIIRRFFLGCVTSAAARECKGDHPCYKSVRSNDDHPILQGTFIYLTHIPSLSFGFLSIPLVQRSEELQDLQLGYFAYCNWLTAVDTQIITSLKAPTSQMPEQYTFPR